VYDEDGSQYIAVFSRNELRLWTEHEENLDKVKKIKVSNIQRYTVLGDLENFCTVLDCEVLPLWRKGDAKHLLFVDRHFPCRPSVGLPSSLQKGLRLHIRLFAVSLCT